MQKIGENLPVAEVARRIVILTVMAIIIGAVASAVALGFVSVVEFLNQTLLISPRSRVIFDGSETALAVITVLVPTLGGIVVGILLRSFGTRSLGPPDVITAVQLNRPLVAGGIGSTLAAMISLGAGASVGQYGPMVFLGAIFGGVVRKLSVQIPNIREIAICCGVAAAIAAAFNAPIAGLIFAHEVILRHYSTRAFAPVTVAATTGFVIANVIFDRDPLFLVAFDQVQQGYEFILFALLGLLSSAVAIGFMKLVLSAGTFAGKSAVPAWLRPGIAGAVLGVTAMFIPEILGIGQEVLRFATIADAFATHELALVLIAKIALTALCLGFGFAGGIFSPSLLIGILFGALFWSVLTPVLPNSGIIPYALAGMMAVTSSVIGAPLTCIVILFELTHNYALTVAAMVAVVFSNMLSHRLMGRSIFDIQLKLRKIDFSQGRDRVHLAQLPVRDLITQDIPLLSAGMSVSQANASIRNHAQGFVLDDSRKLIGTYNRGDEGSVADHLRPATLIFSDDQSVYDAMTALGDFVGDAVPVTDRQGIYRGAVPEAALIRAYIDASTALREEENAPI